MLEVTLSVQLNMLNTQEHARILAETTHSLQIILSVNNYNYERNEEATSKVNALVIRVKCTIYRSTEPLVLQILEDQINYKIESKNIPYLNFHRKINSVAMIQNPIEFQLLRCP